MPSSSISPYSFTTFGDLLKYLRRGQRLTQLELSIAVGYSESQITRLEKNQRLPDIAAVKALFVPALQLENEPELIKHFLNLAESARQEDAPAPGIAPYKGLLFFDESDSELFFGREALTAHLVGHAMDLAMDASTRFLAVVGASGSGKSSLVRAGLAVALKRAGWDIRVFTPTTNPLKMLAANINTPRGKSSERVLILVDQFEELFTLCRDELERITFIEKLLSSAQDETKKTTVVIALRADFYSHCAQYPLLRQVVAAEQEYIGQMTTEELRRAIEEPAKRGDWEFEPGLVDVLLQDIGAQGSQEPEPGALPLLSHALLATWARRQGRLVTLKGYYAAGGVRSAIAETAESVFTDQLNQAQQELARDVFLRLTELGEGTEDTRRRAALNELVRQSAEAPQLRAVLNTLAEARLITLNEDSAEVAHEALIREWQRLHSWLTEDREGLLLHRHLTESAHEWEARGRDVSELYRGARLAQANEWSVLNPNALNAQERMFLDASNMQAKQEEQEREAQRERELAAAKELAETQRQSASRLRIRNRVITTVGTVAIILAMLAGLLGLRSNQNARTAFARELAAASLSNLDSDPERSILLALHGVSVTAPDKLVLPEVEDALHRALASSRIRKTFAAHQGQIWAMAYSPDGTRLATSAADKKIQIWDTTSYKNLLTLNLQDAEVKSITFSPDGTRIAAASSDNSGRIWEVKSGQLVFELKGHTKAVQAIAFSPNGKQLATSSLDKSIKFWDAATGKELATWRDIQEPTNQLVYSPDGKRILFVDDQILFNEGGNLHIMDTSSGEEIYRVPVGYYGFALSPNGKQLALTPTNKSVIRVLNASNGQLLYSIRRPHNVIKWMEFSPDSSGLAVAGVDRKVHVWDAGTGIESFTLSGHTESVEIVAFSTDGKHLASGAFDGTIKIWSLGSSAEDVLPEVFPIELTGGVSRLEVSPDGALIAAVGYSQTTNKEDSLTMWDAQNGNLVYERKAHTEFPVAIAFSPDSKEVATGGADYTIKVWDAERGTLRLNLPVEDGIIWGIAYHPDGHTFAVVGSEGIIRLYDRATGKALSNWDAGMGALSRVAFSPDGSRLATVSLDVTDAKVWDAETGKELLTLTGHTDGNWGVAFSPDGTRIVTSGWDGTVRVWDASNGELIRTLAGHTSTVVTARFSPDGKRIATASKDGTNRVWDAATGKELLSVAGVFSPNDVDFTPDGKRLVIGGRGIQVIALTVDELVQIARSRLTRSLTTEECQKYLHVDVCPDE